MERRRVKRQRTRKLIFQRRKQFMQIISVIPKDEITFMEQEFQALVSKVQKEEEKKLRLIVDNTPRRVGETLQE
jgi:hypothetical protein